MLFCIIATREMDGDVTFHKEFDHTPTRAEILKAIEDQDCGYDDDYGKFRFFQVDVPTKTEEVI
jgi:hypothetical protein